MPISDPWDRFLYLTLMIDSYVCQWKCIWWEGKNWWQLPSPINEIASVEIRQKANGNFIIQDHEWLFFMRWALNLRGSLPLIKHWGGQNLLKTSHPWMNASGKASKTQWNLPSPLNDCFSWGGQNLLETFHTSDEWLILVSRWGGQNLSMNDCFWWGEEIKTCWKLPRK